MRGQSLIVCAFVEWGESMDYIATLELKRHMTRHKATWRRSEKGTDNSTVVRRYGSVPGDCAVMKVIIKKMYLVETVVMRRRRSRLWRLLQHKL
ncbi:hypothetical protein FKM82_029887 [Ascaphus truei]